VAVLRTRIADEHRTAWKALAERVGVNESELLRRAVMAVLAGNQPGNVPAAGGDDAAEHEELRYTRIGLKESEFAAVTAAAEALGWRRNIWIVNMIRTALFNQPHPTLLEAELLRRSNSHMLAIGRNVNQLAHALHRDDRYKDSVTVEKLDALRAKIASHVAAVQGLLAAAQNRWKPPADSQEQP
jgi:hypothetical protein